MIKGLVDTDDIPGSLARIISTQDTREPLVEQLALIMQIMLGSAQSAPKGVEEAPNNGQRYARQNASWAALDDVGPWQACTYPPGCSGSLQIRSLGTPPMGMIEVMGFASATTPWDGSYSFILANMPPSLMPSADQFALVPSSSTPGTPDQISCAWFKPTGEIAMSELYGKGPNPTNPLIAWFDAITIQS